MKPISVKFQYFGPYKKETFVDFEKLEKQGLFLIYGETGAGKTTILDAICYALYGKSSGGNRGDLSSMRCKMAGPSDETKVEFTFEVNGKCYRFVRSLRYGRKNLLDTHNCMVQEDGVFVPIFENPKLKNVNQKAEELVGLTHEQFRQVVMLPQGQFEKLLVSDSAEKEKILVSLFRAEKWQEIAEEMYSRVLEEDRKLRVESADLKGRMSDYKCETLEELRGLRLEEEKRLQILSETLKIEEEKEKEQKAIYERAVWCSEQFLELRKCKKRVAQLEGEQEQIQRMQAQLARADLADKIKGEYDAFVLAKSSAAEWERKKAECQERTRAAKEMLEKVEKRKEAHENGKAAYEEGIRTLAKLENAQSVYATMGQHKAKVAQAEHLVQEAQTKLRTLKAGYEEQQLIWVAKMEEQKVRIERYASAQKLYLDGISGTLAEKLVENVPCPVCGSVEHPNPAKSTGEKVTESQLDQYNREMSEANRAVEKSAAKRAEAERLYQQELVEVNEVMQQAAHFRTVYEEVLRQKIDGIESVEELQNQIQDLKTRIDKYQELTQRFQNMLVDAQAKLHGEEEHAKQIEETLNKAQKEWKAAEQMWEHACEEAGFSGTAEFQKFLMKTEEKNHQKENVIRFWAEQEAAKKSLEEQEKLLKDIGEPNLQIEKQKMDEISANCKKISKDCILKTQYFEKMQKDLENFSARKEAYDVQRAHVDENLEFVNRLRGRTGVSLQRYVLGVMLSSITAEANRLLKNVHGGRYQLYRTDAIAGSGHKGGLELEVLDALNDEKRSVTTLSGGEKFLVALSLAIGLSTVVQAQGKGIRLGAMFIDEGFGSLDQNSIYDALEVLQGIQKANGIVGIISHVELLRDVIPCKIEVHKGKEGSELTIS